MAIDFKQIEMYSDKIYDKVLGYREHLHRNPELVLTRNTIPQNLFHRFYLKLVLTIFQSETRALPALISGDHHSENMACIASKSRS